MLLTEALNRATLNREFGVFTFLLHSNKILASKRLGLLPVNDLTKKKCTKVLNEGGFETQRRQVIGV